MLIRRWSPLAATALLALAASAPVSAQTQQTAATPAQPAPPVALPDACLDAAGYAAAVSRLQAAREAGAPSIARPKNP